MFALVYLAFSTFYKYWFKLIRFFYILNNIKPVFINLSLFVGLLFFLLYFSYVAIFGNNGLKSYIDLEFEIIEFNNNFNSLEKIMQELEIKTSKLSNNLDLDLLDQQSRIVLGLIRNDEIMIIEK